MSADRIADDPVPATRAAGAVEWRRGAYLVSTDPTKLDIPAVATVLARTYWAPEISEAVVRRSIDHSVPFGLYDGDQQIGFARVVTDLATFAWIGDVYVLPEHRGRGLALWLVRCILAHPDLQGLRRWMLATRDAQGLYERAGFRPLAAPQRFMEIADVNVHRRQAASPPTESGDG